MNACIRRCLGYDERLCTEGQTTGWLKHEALAWRVAAVACITGDTIAARIEFCNSGGRSETLL